MLRLLIPCLIWLSSVRAETATSMHMHDGGTMEDGPTMTAMKRESYYDPCPPTRSHPVAYSPAAQIYVKPYPQPVPIQYAPKPMITYVKQAAPPVVVQPIVQPKPVYPIYRKPMLSYASIYQKPVYYAPMYQKLMYQAPKVYSKPQIAFPVRYHPPKVVQVLPPQIDYAKPVYQSAIKPYCP